MGLALAAAVVLVAADVENLERVDPRDTWRNNARFFVGARTGVGFSPGGQGPSPTFGLELGVSNRHGVGFGLHLLSSTNPQALPALGIPKAAYAFGGAADLRIYIQTVEPLTLYPSFSLGFLTGPADNTGTNVVLPLANLGFGARIRLSRVYVAVELGLASFHIPFVSLCFGYESKARYEPSDEEDGLIESAPPPQPRAQQPERPSPTGTEDPPLVPRARTPERHSEATTEVPAAAPRQPALHEHRSPLSATRPRDQALPASTATTDPDAEWTSPQSQ
jgi:hypothetical protein